MAAHTDRQAQTEQRQRARRWLAATLLGVGVWAVFGFLYWQRGQPNADEGWYLYASRLVYAGQLPYRDFSHSQMPLLPYIYGLPQRLLGPGLLVGRATSLALATANLVVSIALARRLAGARAGALAAWLAAAFTYGIYYTTIVKTYALTALLFGLAALALAQDWPEELRLPLATALGLLSGIVRASALTFGVWIAAYAFFAAKRWRTRALIVTVSLALVGALALAFGPLWRLAYWNVFGYHLARWGSASWGQRIATILLERLPSLWEPYGAYLVFGGALAYVAWRQTAWRAWTLARPALWVTAMGLLLFCGSHGVGGGWHKEYLVPALVSAAPLLAALVCALGDATHPSTRSVLRGMTIAVVVSGVLSHGVEHLPTGARPYPLDRIVSVSRWVAHNTAPADDILALEALWVAVDADRDTLPGLAMAQYSYQNVSRERALELQAVNDDILLEYMRQGRAKVIILTELDWDRFEGRNLAQAVRSALGERYTLALEEQQFGQRESKVWVYLRQ